MPASLSGAIVREYMLAIYWLWHNWCAEKERDITPAMRMGLAARPLNTETLIEQGPRAALKEARGCPHPGLDRKCRNECRKSAPADSSDEKQPVRLQISPVACSPFPPSLQLAQPRHCSGLNGGVRLAC